MTTVVYLCGLHSVGLAVFHMMFWKIFNWRSELKSCSVSTRAIIQIANLRLIYFFLVVALLCFAFPVELVSTTLGRSVMARVSIFWIGRTFEQFIFLPYNRAIIHMLTLVFILGAFLFAIPVLISLL